LIVTIQIHPRAVRARDVPVGAYGRNGNWDDSNLLIYIYTPEYSYGILHS
jgi:hypothetical protein